MNEETSIDYGGFVDEENFVGECGYMKDLRKSREEKRFDEELENHYEKVCSVRGRCLTRKGIIKRLEGLE